MNYAGVESMQGLRRVFRIAGVRKCITSQDELSYTNNHQNFDIENITDFMFRPACT